MCINFAFHCTKCKIHTVIKLWNPTLLKLELDPSQHFYCIHLSYSYLRPLIENTITQLLDICNYNLCVSFFCKDINCLPTMVFFEI